MADTNEYLIGLTGGLDATRTKSQINSDIETIKGTLNKINLTATVGNVTMTQAQIQALQTQLGSLQAQLNNVTISQAALDQMVTDVNNALQRIQIANINVGQSGQQAAQAVEEQMRNTLQDISIPNLGLNWNINQASEAQLEAQVESIVNRISNDGNTAIKVKWDTTNIQDKDTGEWLKELSGATINYTTNAGYAVTQTLKMVDAVDSLGNPMRTLVETNASYTQGVNGASSATNQFADKLSTAVTQANINLNKVTNDVASSAKQLTDASHIDSYNQQVDKVRAAIELLDSADQNTFTDAKNLVNEEIATLKNLVTQYQNAEYAATSLRTKDIQTIKTDELNRLDEFVAKMQASGNYTQDLQNKANSLRGTLQGVTNTTELTAYLNQFSNLKSEFQAVNAQAKQTQTQTKLDFNTDTETKKLAALKSELSSLGADGSEVKARFDALEASLKNVTNTQGLTTWRAELRNASQDLNTFKEAGNISNNASLGEYSAQITDLISKTQAYTDANGNSRVSIESLNTAYNEFNAALGAFKADKNITTSNNLIAAQEKLQAEYEKTSNDLNILKGQYASDSEITSFHQKIQQFYDINTKAHSKYGTQLKQMLNQTSEGAQVTNKQMTQLKTNFTNVTNACRQAGLMGNSFFDTMKQGMKTFSMWTSSTAIIMKTVSAIKNAIDTVNDLDDALIDLQKTADATATQLEDFYEEANDLAKEYGATTEEIIQSAADWSRAGYSLSDSETMSTVASIMTTVSSDIDDVSDSTTGLISIMKAFGIEAEDALDGIVSKINIIGNNFSTTNGEIVTMLEESSSAMAAANNSLEETIALSTAAQEIVQDASTVGNAFKTKFCLYVQKCA